MKKYFSYSAVFAVATLLISSFVAFLTNGNPLANLSSAEMLQYGAVDGTTLFANNEIQRLISAQLIHQKPGHMIFNVAMCWYLGVVIESALGPTRFVILYWIGGAIGMLASVYFLPDLVSSGSSQALMSLCAAIVFMKWRTFRISRTGLTAVIVTLIFQIGLDVYFSKSLKPGHTGGLIAGFILSMLLIPKNKMIRTA